MFRKMELEILQDPGNNCICENQNIIHHKGTKNTKNTKIFSSSFLCVLCAFVVGKILSLPKKCTLKSNVHFSESVSRVCFSKLKKYLTNSLTEHSLVIK